MESLPVGRLHFPKAHPKLVIVDHAERQTARTFGIKHNHVLTGWLETGLGFAHAHGEAFGLAQTLPKKVDAFRRKRDTILGLAARATGHGQAIAGAAHAKVGHFGRDRYPVGIKFIGLQSVVELDAPGIYGSRVFGLPDDAERIVGRKGKGLGGFGGQRSLRRGGAGRHFHRIAGARLQWLFCFENQPTLFILILDLGIDAFVGQHFGAAGLAQRRRLSLGTCHTDLAGQGFGVHGLVEAQEQERIQVVPGTLRLTDLQPGRRSFEGFRASGGQAFAVAALESGGDFHAVGGGHGKADFGHEHQRLRAQPAPFTFHARRQLDADLLLL